MPRKSLPLGPETLGLLEEARTDLLHALLGEREDENEPVIALPQDVPLPEDDAAVDAYRQNITESLSQFTRDELRPVEQRSRRVRMLARGKGIVSLETIVERQLDDEAICEFERQPDHLCRSIWAFLNARETFENAESFHFARQFRDHGKLYDAFEVDLENAESLDATAVDETALAKKGAAGARVAPGNLLHGQGNRFAPNRCTAGLHHGDCAPWRAAFERVSPPR